MKQLETMGTLQLMVKSMRLSFRQEFRSPLFCVYQQSLSVPSASKLRLSASPRTGLNMSTKTSSPLLVHSKIVGNPSRSSERRIGLDMKMSGTGIWSGGHAQYQTVHIPATGRTTLSNIWSVSTRWPSPSSKLKRLLKGRRRKHLTAARARVHLPRKTLTRCGNSSIPVTKLPPISPRRRNAGFVVARAKAGRS